MKYLLLKTLKQRLRYKHQFIPGWQDLGIFEEDFDDTTTQITLHNPTKIALQLAKELGDYLVQRRKAVIDIWLPGNVHFAYEVLGVHSPEEQAVFNCVSYNGYTRPGNTPAENALRISVKHNEELLDPTKWTFAVTR